MIKIKIDELHKLLKERLLREGVEENIADIVANVYVRASYRGVGHHDVNDFISRINHIKRGGINPNAVIKKISGFAGIESYDGDNGFGEYCTDYATKRSMILAKEHGIGFCTICNSNHFLAAAPYVEMADEEGFLTIVMSKSPGGISLPGTKKNIMGNNPFGYAASYDEGQIIFDICNAYSSFGKMGQLARDNKKVPDYWGENKEGQPTKNPQEIRESGLYMPMGGHKGFGLAMMIEVFTAVIGGGTILNQGENVSGMKGAYSQSAISIDVSKLMPREAYKDRVSEMVEIFRELYSDIYIPGERSNKEQKRIKEQGYFEISEEVLNKLQ